MGKEAGGAKAQQSRMLVAQQAARLMAEEGIADYAFAKRKAARQLGMEEANCLPTNAEIESELRIHQGIYQADTHPEMLYQLRVEAVQVMRLLDRFDPQLSGPVLDGTAGRYAETEIHLFADSDKEVEIFLLNKNISYQTGERSFHYRDERRKLPMFTIEGALGPIKLVVFSPDDIRSAPRGMLGEGAINRARTAIVEHLIIQTTP
ncbi:uncharacterized protein NMK_1474 [Novimethylophilus kurashikiensis]|uniref:Uncharacterized protein n=1 Tax=Novimethylophilus kurashikiensis TaxID=1825523 RepID=A0A2R5F6N2_9PROT|nr:hypothetical protein [Novimethylophilus kurashikiensis]GBG13922.1 uncharacterized protein NMK_1474 [Novimethylophilus kurashikiensis]